MDKVRFTFRLPVELYNRLQQEAGKRGISVNSLISLILWEYTQKELNNGTTD